MTTKEENTHGLVDSSDSSGSSEEEEIVEDGGGVSGTHALQRRLNRRIASQWWFQHPEVKQNYLTVIGVWTLLSVSIAGVLAGIVLEIIFHTVSNDVFRGFIVLIASFLLLIIMLYAVIHIYLAAKRVGRIRMSSVWFFR